MHNPIADFNSYMMTFYGAGGIYDHDFTPDEIMHGTIVYMQTIGANYMHGDTVDRESIRDIVLKLREVTL